MEASIRTNSVTNELTITIQGLNWEACQQAAFYAGEVQVRDVLQVIGHALTRELLQAKAVTPPRLEYEGQTYYRKAATPGQYQTPYGAVVVERHLYQSSAGGATICPLEQQCQLCFGSATPRLAEIVSFKLASQTAREVEQDLARCQGLTLSDTYLRELGERVGQLARDRIGGWQLEGPALPTPVATIATGVDGTTIPIVGEAYKEARCGTIAVYDTDGARLHTEYLGAMPEAGKTTFATRFTARVAQVLARAPHARHVCLGDGAQWNWDFFAAHYPDAIWVLDFYHAATHLHTVAELLFGKGTAAAEAYYDRWRATLLEEPNGVAALLRSLIYYRNRTDLTPRAAQAVETELTYFRTHTAQMQYATFRAAHLPIGSGVTEAGCKELIKARFCRSGMRWKRPTGAPLLQLRAIRLSQYWDSFWNRVLRYAA
jgi:hypothetical protein